MEPYDDNKVSIQDLADAIRMQKGRQSQQPWWVKVIFQFGVGTAFAFLFFRFMTGEMATSQKSILDNTAANRSVMAQAQKDMGEFAVDDRRFKDVMLAVMRQTCRNAVPTNSPTARTDRDACDVIQPPR